MSGMGQPVPPSPMRLQSPAICQRPAATGPRPGLSTVQETRVPTLPEDEGFMRAVYVTLAANDDTLQELAGCVDVFMCTWIGRPLKGGGR